jgi:hypothetical protein
MLEWSKGLPSVINPRASRCWSWIDRPHRNKQVHGVLQEGGVKTLLLPPQASKPISPCDNTFFSSFKARMRRTGTSTTEEKRHTFQSVCDGYTRDEVKAHFAHCGWDI